MRWPTPQAWQMLCTWFRHHVLPAQRYAQTVLALLGCATTELGQVSAALAAAGWKQVRRRMYSLNWWQLPLPLLINAGAGGA